MFRGHLISAQQSALGIRVMSGIHSWRESAFDIIITALRLGCWVQQVTNSSISERGAAIAEPSVLACSTSLLFSSTTATRNEQQSGTPYDTCECGGGYRVRILLQLHPQHTAFEFTLETGGELSGVLLALPPVTLVSTRLVHSSNQVQQQSLYCTNRTGKQWLPRTGSPPKPSSVHNGHVGLLLLGVRA